LTPVLGRFTFWCMSKAWTKDIKIDPGTFGGSRACHILVEMMNENLIPIYEKHRVLAFINSINIEFKAIETIQSPPVHAGIKESLLNRSKNHYLDRVKEMDYPEVFKTLLNNVIHYRFKKSFERSSSDSRKKGLV